MWSARSPSHSAGAWSGSRSRPLFWRGLPESSVVVVGVTVLDVLVVLAVAHYWGIHAAVPVGVASVVALDWHYIPPTHESAVPDGRNAAALRSTSSPASCSGQLALAARRRADVSEGARVQLADEQAALRRVATLVARETSPAEVFAAVTEEVGRLLAIDIATMLRYETNAGRDRGRGLEPVGISTFRSARGCGWRASNVAGHGAELGPAGADRRLRELFGLPGGAVAGDGRPIERRKPDHRRRPPVGRDGRARPSLSRDPFPSGPSSASESSPSSRRRRSPTPSPGPSSRRPGRGWSRPATRRGGASSVTCTTGCSSDSSRWHST